MNKAYFLFASNKEIDSIISGLNQHSFEGIAISSLFELKKRCSNAKADIIFVADNLKEKDINQLVPSILGSNETGGLPVIGITTTSGSLESTKAFFAHGAVDVIHLPADIEEIILRTQLRMQEAGIQNALTPNDYFFYEAQEKEQGKRSGIFHFYNQMKVKVGDISIIEGFVVCATYGSIIKEDAFLQLACSPVLSFRFEDKTDIKEGIIKVGITNLLLEAFKLKDEIKKQEIYSEDTLKGLIIDGNRIARLLANRALKDMQIESKVVGSNEFSIRLLARFTPNFLILDYSAAEKILDIIWHNGRTESDIPVIIYCDEDIKDINFSKIGKHIIDYVIYKKQLHLEIKEVLSKLFNFSPENK
jgi:DNA-binding response OmpR family regulator